MFDLFFVSPFYTFAVDHEKYLISFAVMAAIGFMFSTFSDKLKQQLRATSARERHLRELYQLARSLAAASSNEEIFRITHSHLAVLCDAEIGFFRLNGDVKETLWQQQGVQAEDVKLDDISTCLREHCELMETGHREWNLQYFPMGLKSSPVVSVARIDKSVSDEQRNLLHTCLSLVNLAITRSQLSEQASQAKLQAESEQLRNAILSAVSHDLRTPLSTIMGLVSTLLDSKVRLDAALTTEFLDTIYNMSEQLSQKVTNLLQMSRTLGGRLQPRLELQNPEELIGSVLSTMKHRLENHIIRTDLDDTLLVALDLSLMEVVLSNLLDNAVKFSPLQSTIYISGKRHDQYYEISVRDQGAGLGDAHDQQLFEQFYRMGHHNIGGTGLGLAITKTIVEAHGGHVNAVNAAAGGATFTVQLPLESTLQEVISHAS
jgi:two-component system sensor histidine kinase KdpD